MSGHGSSIAIAVAKHVGQEAASKVPDATGLAGMIVVVDAGCGGCFRASGCADGSNAWPP